MPEPERWPRVGLRPDLVANHEQSLLKIALTDVDPLPHLFSNDTRPPCGFSSVSIGDAVLVQAPKRVCADGWIAVARRTARRRSPEECHRWGHIVQWELAQELTCQETNCSTDSPVVHHDLLLVICSRVDLCHGRVHQKPCTIELDRKLGRYDRRRSQKAHRTLKTRDKTSANHLVLNPARVKRVVASVKRLKAGYRCSSDVL